MQAGNASIVPRQRAGCAGQMEARRVSEELREGVGSLGGGRTLPQKTSLFRQRLPTPVRSGP
jgi:hypothetical protein